MDSHHLGVLLELAYRGDAVFGGGCRDNRCEGCGICEAFTLAEAEVYGRPATPEERNWWSYGRWNHLVRAVHDFVSSRAARLGWR